MSSTSTPKASVNEAPTRAAIWEAVRREVENDAAKEPVLQNFFNENILKHKELGAALSAMLATKMANDYLTAKQLTDLFNASFSSNGDCLACDIHAIHQRDSACTQLSDALLYNKGFHALSAWRAAHQLWKQEKYALAMALQNRISVVFGVDIHPAATIGKGIMFDHATGIVIGETAVIEDCVSIMQSVTLGGTGKESGDRHPKVRRGVLIGPGAKILGNIEIGEGSKVTAASVVLQNIPPHSLVAGVPAKVVGQLKVESPAEQMDQGMDCCK